MNNSTPEIAEEGKSKSRINKLLQILSGTTYEQNYRTETPTKTPLNFMDKEYLNRPSTPPPTLPAPLPKEATQLSQDFKMTDKDFTSRSVTPKPKKRPDPPMKEVSQFSQGFMERNFK